MATEKKTTVAKPATKKAVETPKTVKVKEEKKTATKQLKVTYVRSIIGYNKYQGKVVEALGFKKLGQTRILPDNNAIRGSIFLVKHLLKVEELN